MTFEDLIPVLMPTTFLGLVVLERLFPAREQPHVRWWLARGVLWFLMVGAINAIVPAVVLGAVGDRSLLHLGWLGTLGGAAVAIVAGDLFGYWVHRGMHTYERVWRWTHQLHHSSERLDMGGSAVFHPFDSLLQQVMPGVLLAVILGITPTAGAVAGFAGYLLGVTPHLNVRTPRWLGWVFQRPEMHAVHHSRGVHAYNYGSLALSDLLFGTWRNPESFPDGAYGFWDGASDRVGAMLLGRDVSQPPR